MSSPVAFAFQVQYAKVDLLNSSIEPNQLSSHARADSGSNTNHEITRTKFDIWFSHGSRYSQNSHASITSVSCTVILAPSINAMSRMPSSML